MQAAAGRDRIYVLTLVLTLVAICAFGVFVIRDYQDQGSQKVGLARLGGGTAAQGDSSLPSTGDTGSAAAQGTTGTTGTAGSSAGSSAGSVGGTSPGGSAGTSAGSAGGSSAGSVARAGNGAGAAAAPVPAPVAGPGGTSPACVNGHIRIGQIVAITGPLTMQTAANATASYFKKVNSQGGINGCQVDFTYLDDGGLDQQKAAADARELVQQDNVFAVVGGYTPITSSTTAPYFAKQGVPLVGSEGISLYQYNNPVIYSFACGPSGFGVSILNEANRLGYKKVAVFYIDLDSIQLSFAALKEQAAKNGQEIVYSNNENISSATYGTDVVAARNANPDVVLNILDANSAVREINAMASNGWYPNLVGTTSSSDPVVIQQGAAWFNHPGHTVYAARNYWPANANVPEVQDWIQTEGQYFPGFDPNTYAEGSWLAAKIFTEQARKLGSGLTRASLINALNNLRNYHTGFTPDLTMTPDHGPNKQILYMKWDGTQFNQATPFGPW
ncbi:MAG TPA: ABC transporter substrate-binding protein [Candidatus Dormibacteraeota bacterium]|nr:ABC transporter substrate-binding protein [Candidatus Dormibacteraeota bacterium]